MAKFPEMNTRRILTPGYQTLPGRTCLSHYFKTCSGWMKRKGDHMWNGLHELPFASRWKHTEDIEVILTPDAIRTIQELDAAMPSAHYRHFKCQPTVFFKLTPDGRLNEQTIVKDISIMTLEDFIACGAYDERWAAALRPYQYLMQQRLKHMNAMTCLRTHSIYTMASLCQNRMGLDGRNARTLRTVIHMACYLGHEAAVDLYLRSNCGLEVTDVNKFTPLMMAIAGGHVNIVRHLLGRQAEPDHRCAEGQTPLFQAVALWLSTRQEKYIVIADLLLKRGANIHAQNIIGDSPAKLAARINAHNKEMLKMITGNHARHHGLDWADENGFTLLMFAAQYGAWSNARHLLVLGCNPNRQNKRGDTALSMATIFGHHILMILLLEFRADANIINHMGQSPLYSAAHERATKAAEILLYSGATTNTIDIRGLSPTCYAISECGLEARTLSLLASWPTTPSWAREAAQDYLSHVAEVIIGAGPFTLSPQVGNVVLRDIPTLVPVTEATPQVNEPALGLSDESTDAEAADADNEESNEEDRYRQELMVDQITSDLSDTDISV